MKVNIKPLSVNQCWAGRRFKTPKYKDYEQELLLLLPNDVDIPEGDLCCTIEVAYSNRAADIDNFLKPFIDVLQKKYDFNDKNIYKLDITKVIVKKGEEYIDWSLTSMI